MSPNLIAAIIYDIYSVGPSMQPICTRRCFTISNMIQVCSNFHWTRVFILHTRLDEIPSTFPQQWMRGTRVCSTVPRRLTNPPCAWHKSGPDQSLLRYKPFPNFSQQRSVDMSPKVNLGLAPMAMALERKRRRRTSPVTCLFDRRAVRLWDTQSLQTVVDFNEKRDTFLL